MLSFFKNKRKDKAINAFSGPEGALGFMIGDVHGCFDAMIDLLGQIEAHCNAYPDKEAHIIFLGDLMDRGPDSQRVIEYLRSYQPNFASVRFIMGNHEEVMLNVVNGDADAMMSWFQFGGKACARSYGVTNLGEALLNPEDVVQAIQRAVPKVHVEFLRKFEVFILFGDFLCVHAGIKPGIKIESQSETDMRWIRKRFIDYKKPHPYMIVHGHTVVETAEVLSNRIPVDTGACHGGMLTALVVDGTNLSFLHSQPTDNH